VPEGGEKGVSTGSNDCLVEAAALAEAVQAQLLVAVVFMVHDPDRLLDRVRQLTGLRRRMTGLIQRRSAVAYARRRRARTRL
jgi:hypothetical protein